MTRIYDDGDGEFVVSLPRPRPAPGPTAIEPAYAAPLETELRARLIADYDLQADPDGALRFGLCPACHRKSLAALGAVPLHLYCNRTAKCGWEGQATHLYPDLFEGLSERYPVTPEDAHATAAAYLRYVGGFDPAALAGIYSQGTFWRANANRGTATVRFPVADGVHYDAFVDPVTLAGRDTPKTFDITGTHAGLWWSPLSYADLAKAEEVWLTVHPLDALALHLAGVAAVAVLKTKVVDKDNYPAEALTQLAAACMAKGRPALVWAIGPTNAYTRDKWIKRARVDGWQCHAAQPEKKIAGLSWLDLSIRQKLGAEHRADYRHCGALDIAPSAAEKARLIYQRQPLNSFHLDHGNRLFWFSLDTEKFNKEVKRLQEEESHDEAKAKEEALKMAGSVEEICDCLPEVLYYQANEVTDEYWYYTKIEFPHGGPAVKNTFTSGQLTAPAEFKKRLFAVAPGALWTGKPQHLDRLLKAWTYNVKVVKTIDYTGYAKDYGAWLFSDIAIQGGKLYRSNHEDYFELARDSVKSLSRSVELDINTDLSQFDTAFLPLLWTCFGTNGIAVLTFWFLSLFAEQIYARLKFMPFLEVVGEPGSGKSTLVEFLWRLIGRMDWEGFDPTNASHSALSRNFNQVSNLPVVLLEGDRTADQATGRPAKSFNWDEVKKLYNRRGFRARGVKNQGNDTYDPPFRGTLIALQNHPIQADRPVLERFIQVYFDKKGHTETTRNAARKLETMGVKQLSGFLLKACLNEKTVLETLFEALPKYEKLVADEPTIKTYRIVLHHALMMAGVDALATLLPITEEMARDTRDDLFELAVTRQRSIGRDHPQLEAFWDFLEDIETDATFPVLNHSLNDELIAINLTDYSEYVAKRGLQSSLPTASDLRRLFPNTTTHKFVGPKVVESAILRRAEAKCTSRRCWVFKK